MFVKENQPTLCADIAALFEQARQLAQKVQKHRDPQCVAQVQRVQALGEGAKGLVLRQAQTCEIGHGRIERRELQALCIPEWAHWLNWPGARQIFRLERQTQFKKSQQVRGEVVYGITSVPESLAEAATLLAWCRGHWSIENRCHWVRDVTFDEDRSWVRSGSVPQVMAAFRNTAIGVLRIAGHPNIAAACRSYAARPAKLLPLLLNTPTFE